MDPQPSTDVNGMTRLRLAKIAIWILGSAALVGSLHYLGLSSAANWIQWVTTFTLVAAAGASIEKVAEVYAEHKEMVRKIHEIHRRHQP